MDFNSTLDTIINNVNTNQTTLRSLLAQLQHNTITSSDDELYDAPTLDDATGIWTLAQSTANVGGLYVGCYKLPDNAINSYITSVTVVNNKYTAPSSPTAPASITVAGGSPVDLTDINDLVGEFFNSFCIRSTVAFEIEITVSADICETIIMPATSLGFTYMSQNTESGANYTVAISGLLGMGVGWIIDAFYSDTGGNPGDPSYYLIVNNGTLPPKPAYQSNHTYVLTMVGTGAPFGFRIHDGDGTSAGYYVDNSGSFTIEICREF